MGRFFNSANGSRRVQLCQKCGTKKRWWLSKSDQRWRSKCPNCEKQRVIKCRELNPDRAHDRGLKQRLDLPMGQYAVMLKKQKGVCAICLRPQRMDSKRRLHLDHDHGTKKYRGLLCHGCNVSLGHFLHDIRILKRAILYLQKYQMKKEKP
jgi:hypothetical protein